MRPSGRKTDQMRKVSFERNFSKHAEGSCLVKFGDTHVLVTASLEEKTPPWLRNSGKGWVTAEYGMLPRSTHERMKREAASGKQGGRTQEIQRLIGRSLRAVVDLQALGERQISIDCDVIQADGGTRTASITGAWIALHDCLKWMETRNMINAGRIKLMKHGAILLNFAREGIVENDAVVDALEAKRIRCYVCDFPARKLADRADVITLPHLGASTREAEDNCAVMVVDQVRDFLENGNIVNAVNFPDVVMAREAPYRVGIANANVPNMVGQISTAMAKAGLNIHNMINKSKGEMAYTLVDVDSKVPARLVEQIGAIEGVLAVRYLPAEK